MVNKRVSFRRSSLRCHLCTPLCGHHGPPPRHDCLTVAYHKPLAFSSDSRCLWKPGSPRVTSSLPLLPPSHSLIFSPVHLPSNICPLSGDQRWGGGRHLKAVGSMQGDRSQGGSPESPQVAPPPGACHPTLLALPTGVSPGGLLGEGAPAICSLPNSHLPGQDPRPSRPLGVP